MFETASNLHTFWIKVKAEYPEITTKVLKSPLPFPISHLCEAQFSAVTATNMRFQSRLDIRIYFASHCLPSPLDGTLQLQERSSGLSLIPHYGEWYNYFILYHNVIIIETKCTINVMHLNHPKTSPTLCSVEKLSSMKPVKVV